MTTQTQKYIFHIHGMHCNACVLMIESELGDLPNITHVKSSLKNHSIEVIGGFGDKTPEQIAEELTVPLKPHGYTVSVEKQQHEANWEDFKIAVPIAVAFAVLFVVLQKAGLVNLVNTGSVTYATAFFIGIIASLSTCMAVVGGLVLSMSATASHELRSAGTLASAVYFHVGRIVAFFILGGIIGAVGSAFQLGTTGTFILGLLIGLVMLVLGINLLDIFHFTKRLQPSMPQFISSRALGRSEEHTSELQSQF